MAGEDVEITGCSVQWAPGRIPASLISSALSATIAGGAGLGSGEAALSPRLAGLLGLLGLWELDIFATVRGNGNEEKTQEFDYGLDKRRVCRRVSFLTLTECGRGIARRGQTRTISRHCPL